MSRRLIQMEAISEKLLHLSPTSYIHSMIAQSVATKLYTLQHMPKRVYCISLLDMYKELDAFALILLNDDQYLLSFIKKIRQRAQHVHGSARVLREYFQNHQNIRAFLLEQSLSSLSDREKLVIFG